MRTRSATAPHEARTAILAIWAWRVRRKRRFWLRFRGLLATERRKRQFWRFQWRAYTPQWIANLTILARNSRKDSKARSAANQPLPTDWRFCKRGLVIPRWLPTRFAQALIEELANKIKRAILATTRFPAPSFTKTPFHPAPRMSCVFCGCHPKECRHNQRKERAASTMGAHALEQN